MRYDRLLHRLDAARGKFEAEVRSILAEASREDRDIAVRILSKGKSDRGEPGYIRVAPVPTPKAKRAKAKRAGPHWTQLARNKARVRALLRKAARAKAAKAKAQGVGNG